MQNAAPTLSTPQTDADYEKAVDLLLAEMNALNRQMDADYTESERLKAETATLKAETAKISAETRAILVKLGARL